MRFNTIPPRKIIFKEGQGVLYFLENQIPKDISQRSGVWLRIHNQHSTSEQKLLLMPASTDNYLLTDGIRLCLSNIYNIY